MTDNKNQSIEKRNNVNTPKKRSFFGGSLDIHAKDLLDFRYSTQEEIDKLNEEMTTTEDLDEIIKQSNRPEDAENNEKIDNKNEDYPEQKNENEDESNFRQIFDYPTYNNTNYEYEEKNEPIEGEIINLNEENHEKENHEELDKGTEEDNSETFQSEETNYIEESEKKDEEENFEEKSEPETEEFTENSDETIKEEIKDENQENEEGSELGDSAKFFDPFELNLDENDEEISEVDDEIFDPFGLNENEDNENYKNKEESNENEISKNIAEENTEENYEEENFEKIENYNEENDNYNEGISDNEEDKNEDIEIEPNEATEEENTEIENEEEDKEIIKIKSENKEESEDEDNTEDINENEENDYTDDDNETGGKTGEENDNEDKDTNEDGIENNSNEDIEDEVSETPIEKTNEDGNSQQIIKTNEEENDEEENDDTIAINTPIAINPNKKDEKEESFKKIKKNSTTGEIVTEEEIELEQGQDMADIDDNEEYQPSDEELFEYEPDFFADDELSQQFRYLVQNVRGIFKLERKDGEQNPYFKILGGKTADSILEYLFYLIEEEDEPIDLYIKKIETNQENEEEDEHLVQFSYNTNKELNIFVDEVILYEKINKSDSNSGEYNDTKSILEKFIFLTDNHYDKLKIELDKQREERQKKKQLQQIFKGF